LFIKSSFKEDKWLDNPSNHLFISEQRAKVYKGLRIGQRIYKKFIVLDFYPNFVVAVHEDAGYTEAFTYFDLDKYNIKDKYPYRSGHQSYDIIKSNELRSRYHGSKLPTGPKKGEE